MKKPNIFITGPSGSGKSSCLRNMDPASTVIFNTERKALPFQKAGRFSANVPIENHEEWVKNFKIALAMDACKCIFTDSFTALCEMIYQKAITMYTGYDVWNYYNQEIYTILNMSKNTDKYVVFCGIDMTIDGAGGIEERCIHVMGKAWTKKVEKEFVIVLFTETKDDGDNVQYIFNTNRKKNITAKSPMGMLDIVMPNDLSLVIEKSENYYMEEEASNTAAQPAQ